MPRPTRVEPAKICTTRVHLWIVAPQVRKMHYKKAPVSFRGLGMMPPSRLLVESRPQTSRDRMKAKVGRDKVHLQTR